MLQLYHLRSIGRSGLAEDHDGPRLCPCASAAALEWRGGIYRLFTVDFDGPRALLV